MKALQYIRSHTALHHANGPHLCSNKDGLNTRCFSHITHHTSRCVEHTSVCFLLLGSASLSGSINNKEKTDETAKTLSPTLSECQTLKLMSLPKNKSLLIRPWNLTVSRKKLYLTNGDKRKKIRDIGVSLFGLLS